MCDPATSAVMMKLMVGSTIASTAVSVAQATKKPARPQFYQEQKPSVSPFPKRQPTGPAGPRAGEFAPLSSSNTLGAGGLAKSKLLGE